MTNSIPTLEARPAWAALRQHFATISVFSERVRGGKWLGHTDKPVRNIANIGSGGSDLGPVMAYETLRAYSDRETTFCFISNVDGTDFDELGADHEQPLTHDDSTNALTRRYRKLRASSRQD